MSKKRKTNKKRKLNKKRLFTFLFIVVFLFLFAFKIFTTNINNIYVIGNSFFSDQEIIDIADIKNYPNSIKNNFITLENKLEKNKYILSAQVKKKKLLSSVYIHIQENYPLFYYLPENKIVLYNGDKVEDNVVLPTVINKIPDTIYNEFLNKIKEIDINILNRISEIEYVPNDVEDERFFLLMNDGNYVYITIEKFLKLNKYFNMIESFNNKKGILYLDSGEYFDIFDE